MDTGEDRREADVQREQKENERARRAAEQQADSDQYDRDIERDNRDRDESTMGSLPAEMREGAEGREQMHEPPGEEHRQHARKGQAQSPRELNHHEPPKQKEGHR